MFELNQLYIQSQSSEQLKPSIKSCRGQKTLSKGLSRMSLFSGISKKNMSEDQEAAFVFLLNFIKQPVFFKKITTATASVIWQIYATQTVLEGWISAHIRASVFDFLLWPAEHLLAPKLLVFDMDSTFIQIEVIDQLAKQQGVGDQVSKLTEAAMQGELDFASSLVSRVACLRGLELSCIDSIVSRLPLSPGIEKLMVASKKNQVQTAIVSGGFTPFVQRLKDKMGLFAVKANNLQVNNGRLTGQLSGSIVDAQAKADFVDELINKLGLHRNEVLTIGDGANDLLMMQKSGFSLAYRAKPIVQEKAKGRMNSAQFDQLISVFGW